MMPAGTRWVARAIPVLLGCSSGGGGASSASASAVPARPPVRASASAAPPVEPPAMMRVEGGSRPRCVFPNARSVSCDGPAIEVGPFLLDTTEVTVDAYAACVKAGACDAAGLDAEHNCNYAAESRGRNVESIGSHPVNCVSSAQARAFCAHANKRLPTRDEWEYAARGADGRIYPWGSTAERWSSSTDLRVWACWRHTGTCKVGTFPPRQAPFELRDMAGNVAEWTSDGLACGSSWLDPELEITEMVALARCRHDKGKPDPTIGFRCAQTLPGGP